MIDVWTVARKELAELLGERAVRRGVQVQTIVLVALLGVLLPSNNPQVWLLGSPYAIAMFLILPAVIAGSIGADAFAGERERRTLETLLATPLSDRAVVAGKALAATLAAVVVALVALLAATITVNLTAHPPALFVPAPLIIGGALLGALACSCVSTSVAIALSLRTPVARSVQQMVSLLFVIPALLAGMLAKRLGIAFDWSNVFALEALVIVTGLAGLAWAAARFQRHRLYLNR
jgi:ABC-2 type transport system permease protein